MLFKKWIRVVLYMVLVSACSSNSVLSDGLNLPDVLTAPGAGFDYDDGEAPIFTNVSVHDPSVFRVGDTFYVIGSHMGMAKTDDLMNWTLVNPNAQPGNVLVPNVREDFADALSWARTTTFWAGDIQQMPGGQFYMYYCNCEGSRPLGCIGLAVADNPEGPYENRGIFLRSGMDGISGDATEYNAHIHPNAVDPHTFFCNDGLLWMVYGSYSGGIYILKMDEETGLPLPGHGYGKKLLGKDHARIEGPYILYSPETQYYYLFLSFGGLGANDGYNMRTARSKSVDGPYLDARGQDMIHCVGNPAKFFDDAAIEPYGVKIMGGYQYRRLDGESGLTTQYRSPGHNSAYYDPETGKYFLVFHIRFLGGDGHEIRVHEMFLNDDGWLVVSPFRYDGGNIREFTAAELVGTYKVILHEQDINRESKFSETVFFYGDGRVGGAYQGEWSLGGNGKTALVTLDGSSYNGVFLRSYDSDHGMWVNSFTAMSADGLCAWGAGAAIS